MLGNHKSNPEIIPAAGIGKPSKKPAVGRELNRASLKAPAIGEVKGVDKKMGIDVQRVTDVRKRFSEFVDTVVHKKPQFVSRNDRDTFMAINLQHLKPLIAGLTFRVNMTQDEDGSFVASFDNFWPVVSEPTEEQALYQLANELMEFAHDYMNDFDMYSKTPKFSQEFPYILKALLSDVDELKESFCVQYERP